MLKLINTNTLNISFINIRWTIWQILSGFFLTLLFVFSNFAQDNVSKNEVKETIKAESGVDVYSYGKDVLVESGVKAKSVFAFGGNITIEGEVEEDVGAMGGSIIQKENGFIGGDVIVIGGTYTHDKKEPLRNKEKQSVVFDVFENELQSIAQNPTQIFAPQFTWEFFAQRLFSMLFWFVIALAFTTIAPGAVSRAVTRFQLSTTKVVGIGFLAFLTATLGVTASLHALPTLSVLIVPMILILLMLAFVYGRVAIQVSIGKWLQKKFWSEKNHSETFSIFIGTFVCTVLTSIPYIWTFAVIFLFAVSLGLVLTARSINNWKKV